MIDIIYLRKMLNDGKFLCFIKKDLMGNKQVYIKNDIGEIVSLGNVADLEKNGEKE